MMDNQANQLAKLHVRKDALCEQAIRMEILDQSDLEKATDLTKWIKILLARIDDERKQITSGIKDSLATINAKYKELSDPLKQAEGVAQSKVTDYMKLSSRASGARGEYGSLATLRDHWTWKITDIVKLAAARPDLVGPNSKALNEAVRKHEIRELPGVHIYNDRRSVIR